MKIFKNKTFLLLVSIFTIFSLILTITYNTIIYNREKNLIRDEINTISNTHQRFPSNIQGMKKLLFMNIEAYVVTFDMKGNISNINSYSESEIDEENIKELVKNIKLEKLDKIDNLYFSKYIYSVNRNRNLIIINNTKGKTYLITSLLISLLLFSIYEIIIIYLSGYLTNWLIKPIEESFEKQKQFTSDASHELKTPLAIIMASVETLENNPEEKKWLENIKEETNNMNKLVSNLLELSKTENIENKEIYTEINLSKLIENKALSFESVMFENKVELNLDIEKEINFQCDQDRIKELLSILLDNAIKHSVNNSKITVTLFKEKDIINLWIKNKGESIPKEEREKIFERFYRIDKSRNRNTNRYGLGLSIAKNIVNNHNGEIHVDCSHGYTTFKVIFKQNCK